MNTSKQILRRIDHSCLTREKREIVTDTNTHAGGEDERWEGGRMEWGEWSYPGPATFNSLLCVPVLPCAQCAATLRVLNRSFSLAATRCQTEAHRRHIVRFTGLLDSSILASGLSSLKK